jgi:predicted amidohydrolase YtcJ
MAPVGFDPKRVADDAIRKLKSVLTVVDGKVVHNTMSQFA